MEGGRKGGRDGGRKGVREDGREGGRKKKEKSLNPIDYGIVGKQMSARALEQESTNKGQKNYVENVR